ncbi:hypothetical protein EYZ11_005435 [Aspergillus tanneri]|uniref:Uncharacterized protein n=1 Tax=Aspergillus tanneri TaxID=1220188 RepID=A0A4S3JKB8_9EURO|nr:hypothetical protein EYZ11_005435 [Aspergillus tanneri]
MPEAPFYGAHCYVLGSSKVAGPGQNDCPKPP